MPFTVSLLPLLICLSLLLASCSAVQDEVGDFLYYLTTDEDSCTPHTGKRQGRKRTARAKYTTVRTNSEEERAVDLLNEIRAEQGLDPLIFKASSPLQRAARLRAQEIATSFSHTRPDGSSCSSVLDEFGLSYHLTGENIAYGTRLDASGVTKMWRKSPGHYQNMVNPGYREIGLAAYHGPGNNIYWVQIFRTR